MGFDEYDVATQRLKSHRFESVDGRLERLSIPFRYAWPSELDFMAQLAGVSLRDRERWKREPFTSDSSKHVSVWKSAATPLKGRWVPVSALQPRAPGRFRVWPWWSQFPPVS